ncbi:hypothetical protein F2Q68_00023318 [Brassica cretica]|uniref:Uncharacterized protein n=1 Tax=Brassica cretica TaxID=69181 RepID=A0A8S9FV89_BRACR|nr:hypothetical protein F2Q68_00023318 [Brassica cretica]
MQRDFKKRLDQKRWPRQESLNKQLKKKEMAEARRLQEEAIAEEKAETRKIQEEAAVEKKIHKNNVDKSVRKEKMVMSEKEKLPEPDYIKSDPGSRTKCVSGASGKLGYLWRKKKKKRENG